MYEYEMLNRCLEFEIAAQATDLNVSLKGGG